MILFHSNTGSYGFCQPGDERHVFAVHRQPNMLETYESIIRDVSQQLWNDCQLSTCYALTDGTRMLVARRSGRVVGLIRIVLSTGVQTEIDAWTVPDRCHPEAVGDFVADAIAYLVRCGSTQDVHVTAHVRPATVQGPDGVVEIAAREDDYVVPCVADELRNYVFADA